MEKEALKQKERVSFLADRLMESHREERELIEALKKKKLQTRLIQEQFDEENSLLQDYAIYFLKNPVSKGEQG